MQVCNGHWSLAQSSRTSRTPSPTPPTVPNPTSSTCSEGYYRDAVSTECLECTGSVFYIGPIIFIGLAVVVVLVTVGVAAWRSDFYARHKDRITRMRDQGTMLFITYQIMNNLQLAHRSAGGEE